MCLVGQGPFYGGLISPSEHSEGQQGFCPFLSEHRLEGGDFIFQGGIEEGVKAEGFDIDPGKGERGQSEGIFGGGDKSVLFGDFTQQYA
jgi:hypothetical protein